MVHCCYIVCYIDDIKNRKTKNREFTGCSNKKMTKK